MLKELYNIRFYNVISLRGIFQLLYVYHSLEVGIWKHNLEDKIVCY